MYSYGKFVFNYHVSPIHDHRHFLPLLMILLCKKISHCVGSSILPSFSCEIIYSERPNNCLFSYYVSVNTLITNPSVMANPFIPGYSITAHCVTSFPRQLIILFIHLFRPSWLIHAHNAISVCRQPSFCQLFIQFCGVCLNNAPSPLCSVFSEYYKIFRGVYVNTIHIICRAELIVGLSRGV